MIVVDTNNQIVAVESIPMSLYSIFIAAEIKLKQIKKKFLNKNVRRIFLEKIIFKNYMDDKFVCVCVSVISDFCIKIRKQDIKKSFKFKNVFNTNCIFIFN